jgi:SAM-dependent methyltransferase
MPQNISPDTASGSATAGDDYAERLKTLEHASWKQRLDVQRPYRWNIRRLNLGRVLDVGCGIGRNLAHLQGNGVGVDHNSAAIAEARSRGLVAFTTDEFHQSEYARPGAFDSLLLAHVAEHVSHDVALEILREYLPYLRPGGRVVFICPQEKGWTTDATHVRFVDFEGLRRLAEDLDLTVERRLSFPFPRPAGRVFPYNEFILVATKAG